MFGRDNYEKRKRPEVLYKELGFAKKNRPMGIHSIEIIHVESRMKYLYVYNTITTGVSMSPILNADGTPMLASVDEINQLLREV
ncbi:MAG: hypothetical protein FWB98_05205 [Defluviitaleaceae bacterium]|nr:hypothetical protein [Defluviitaleaceae bacterium]